MQKDIYTCFIDYSKAFDKGKYHHVVEIFRQLKFDSRDIRFRLLLVYIGKNCSDKNWDGYRREEIKRGARQSFVMFPDIFSV